MNSDSTACYHLSVDIKAENYHEISIIEAIKNFPRVRQCYRVIGKYDIHAAIRVEDLKEMARIKKLVQNIKGVIEVEITTGIDRFCSFPENLLLEPTGE